MDQIANLYAARVERQQLMKKLRGLIHDVHEANLTLEMLRKLEVAPRAKCVFDDGFVMKPC